MKKGVNLNQTGVHWSDSGSLTMTGWEGVSLNCSVSLEMREVRSRLELTMFVSGEPRSIG